jgi:hypothetical protein
MAGYWILNAPGHRLAEFEQVVVAMAETTLTDPDLEQLVADPGEEWVCDGCNGTVAVFQPEGRGGPDPTLLSPTGRLNPVPVLRGAMLCSACFLARMGGDLAPANPWPGCGCDPCRHAAGR